MAQDIPGLDPKILLALVQTKMPFGKYKDTLVCDIPVHYLEWMAREGMPAGKLGMMLNTVLVIKSNGLQPIITNLKKKLKHS